MAMRRGELPIVGRGEVGEAVRCVPKEEGVLTDQVIVDARNRELRRQVSGWISAASTR